MRSDTEVSALDGTTYIGRHWTGARAAAGAGGPVGREAVREARHWTGARAAPGAEADAARGSMRRGALDGGTCSGGRRSRRGAG